ncbi:MAG: hypothetical protein KKC75_05460 [Nanoarchaeota archaeon]|nr:hypothetical protein [Nanoarchaeota archaeon]MBU1005006.1 hypothetical protein [Nanoarchaeota archaeon]MBU1945898.1 hypothetical protein [Nanoarchaeota archaeon]
MKIKKSLGICFILSLFYLVSANLCFALPEDFPTILNFIGSIQNTNAVIIIPNNPSPLYTTEADRLSLKLGIDTIIQVSEFSSDDERSAIILGKPSENILTHDRMNIPDWDTSYTAIIGMDYLYRNALFIFAQGEDSLMNIVDLVIDYDPNLDLLETDLAFFNSQGPIKFTKPTCDPTLDYGDYFIKSEYDSGFYDYCLDSFTLSEVTCADNNVLVETRPCNCYEGACDIRDINDINADFRVDDKDLLLAVEYLMNDVEFSRRKVTTDLVFEILEEFLTFY